MAGNIYDMEFCHPIIVLTLYISQRVQTGSRPADHNGLGRVEKAVINSHPLQAV